MAAARNSLIDLADQLRASARQRDWERATQVQDALQAVLTSLPSPPPAYLARELEQALEASRLALEAALGARIHISQQRRQAQAMGHVARAYIDAAGS